MSTKNYLRGIRVGPRAAASMLLLIAASYCAAPAHAVITDTDWSLKISEREMAFRPATDMMAMKSLMWDLPYSRMFARNMPFICLTNESATASITEFEMTIGDEQFHFDNDLMGMYAKLGKESPTSPGLSSTVEDGGDTLVVNFLNGGLAPGAHCRISSSTSASMNWTLLLHASRLSHGVVRHERRQSLQPGRRLIMK